MNYFSEYALFFTFGALVGVLLENLRSRHIAAKARSDIAKAGVVTRRRRQAKPAEPTNVAPIKANGTDPEHKMPWQ